MTGIIIYYGHFRVCARNSSKCVRHNYSIFTLDADSVHIVRKYVDVEIKTIAQVMQKGQKQRKEEKKTPSHIEWLHFRVCWVDWDAASNGDGFELLQVESAKSRRNRQIPTHSFFVDNSTRWKLIVDVAPIQCANSNMTKVRYKMSDVIEDALRSLLLFFHH